MRGIEANTVLLARRVAESVTLVTALNPIIGYEKAARIAKTVLQEGGTIAEVADRLGILKKEDVEALLVADTLTRPAALRS